MEQHEWRNLGQGGVGVHVGVPQKAVNEDASV
jgi:hypothetical protein